MDDYEDEQEDDGKNELRDVIRSERKDRRAKKGKREKPDEDDNDDDDDDGEGRSRRRRGRDEEDDDNDDDGEERARGRAGDEDDEDDDHRKDNNVVLRSWADGTKRIVGVDGEEDYKKRSLADLEEEMGELTFFFFFFFSLTFFASRFARHQTGAFQFGGRDGSGTLY
jgi:hypothetical protein